ncbi:hypothetical protein [Desulforegula conservatrix]|uniref:hypothetical protein n=1 Tax=Desulforegula conservatrix TaxID=153026 RepID=UPI0003F5D5C7|nr:hypothetical protein [Desulforegula conservatrix]
MKEYQRYEYCNAVKCPRLEDIKDGVKAYCEELCGAYKFHKYLQDQGYKIIKDGE